MAEFAFAAAPEGTVRELFFYSKGVYTTISVPPARNTPLVVQASFTLAESYPNPAAGVAHLRFSLPKATQATLEIFDLHGRRVRVLVDAMMPSGSHEVAWDARNQRGAKVEPGLYFYRLRAGSFRDQKKLVLLP